MICTIFKGSNLKRILLKKIVHQAKFRWQIDHYRENKSTNNDFPQAIYEINRESDNLLSER